jgi:hypothetical protein
MRLNVYIQIRRLPGGGKSHRGGGQDASRGPWAQEVSLAFDEPSTRPVYGKLSPIYAFVPVAIDFRLRAINTRHRDSELRGSSTLLAFEGRYRHCDHQEANATAQ